jgi:hypothetical protein
MVCREVEKSTEFNIEPFPVPASLPSSGMPVSLANGFSLLISMQKLENRAIHRALAGVRNTAQDACVLTGK